MLQTYQIAAYEFDRTMIEDFSAACVSCAWSHTEHGPASLTATISMPLSSCFAWRARPAFMILVHDSLAQRVWAGRVLPDDVAINADESITITAYGFWTAFDDTAYTSLWSSTSVADFRPVGTDERPEANPDLYQFDTNNRLWITMVKDTLYRWDGDEGRLCNEIPFNFGPDYLSRQISVVQFTYEAVLPTTWKASLSTINYDFSGGGALLWVLAGAGIGTVLSGTHTLTNPSLGDRAMFRINNASTISADYTNTTETGVYYLKITGLRVLTATDGIIYAVATAAFAAGVRTITPDNMDNIAVGSVLTVNDFNPVTENVTVTSTTSTTFTATFANAHAIGDPIMGFTSLNGREIVAGLLSDNRTLNSNQLAATQGWIDAPDIEMLDFAYQEQAGTELLTQLASIGDTLLQRWAAGVNVDQQVFFHVRGDGARDWYVNSDELAIAGAGNERFTSAYAIYQDPAGRTKRSDALPEYSADDQGVAALGLVRRAGVSVDTTSLTAAERERDLFLLDRKEARPQAQVVIRILEGRTGTLWPLLSVRPGDTITIRDLPPTLSTTVDKLRTFTIAEVQFDAFVPDVVAVTPEEPLPYLDVLLAQKALRNSG